MAGLATSGIASPADVVLLARHADPQRASAEMVGKKCRPIQLPNLGRALWTLRNFARDSRQDQNYRKVFMKGEDLTLLKQTTQLFHTAFVLESALTVSLKKITSEVKFTVPNLLQPLPRRFTRPSRLIHFDDVSEANGCETPRQKQNANVHDML